MIDLTPLEVRNKKSDFRKGLRGYETAEVDHFLELVAERMEELVRENIKLTDRLNALNQQVTTFQAREQAMNDALVSAQQLREDIQSQARRESDYALKEARSEGERIVESARREVEEQKRIIQSLQARRDRFLRAYHNFLNSQMTELEEEEERIVRARAGEISDERAGDV